MSKKIEFYFDFGSPTAYLAYHRLMQLAERYDAEIEYKGVLLGGVFKASGNSSPIAVPAKGRYMGVVDLPRFAKAYDVEMVFNPHFPINTLPLMRGYYAAKAMGAEASYLQVMFDGMWKNKIDFSKPENLIQVVNDLGLDAEQFSALIASDEIKAQLKEASEELVKRHGFGVPTMYIGKEMFFGQDRLNFIEEELAK